MRRWIAIWVVCLVAAGCDRPKLQNSASSSPAAPQAAPAPQLATLSPATTQPIEAADNAPPSCVMMINQQPVEFPQAMLRISQSGGQVSVLLYSDDPKDALESNYRGNGFYFRLALDVPSVQFKQAFWEHHADSSDRVDTRYGIFLDGHRRQLQPLDVRLRLLPALSGGFKVEMVGNFLSVNPQDDLAPTQVVPVAAWLLAQKP